MIPVLPLRIVRSPEAGHAKLVLRTLDQKRSLTIFVPLEHARQLLAELHGLAGDSCTHHHLTTALVQALDGQIVSVLLRETAEGWVGVAVRINSPWGATDVSVDIVAALSLAVHLGVPIFAEHEHLLSETDHGIPLRQDVPASAPTPAVFREVLESLDLSFLAERQEGEDA